MIENLKKSAKTYELKERELEQELSELKGRYSLAEHDLCVLRIDHDLATSKVEKINKARIEAESSLKDKTERLN